MGMRGTLRALGLWFSTVFRAAPGGATLDVVLMLVVGVTGPLQAYGVKLFIDGLAAKPAQDDDISTGVALVVTSLLLAAAGSVARSWSDAMLNDRVDTRLHADLLALTAKIPGIAHHERPDIADRVSLIEQQARRLKWSLGKLMLAITTLTNVISVVVLLATIHPLLLALPILGLGRVWARVANVRMFFAVVERTTPHHRLGQKLVDISERPRHAMELRVFDLADVLLARIRSLFNQRFIEQRRVVRRGALLEGNVRLAYGVCYAAAIVWVISLARKGQATPGDVGLAILLAPRLDQALGGIAGNVYSVAEFAKMFSNYVWLRDYAKENAWAGGTAPTPEVIHTGIELRDVEFRYPGTGEPVLQDVSLVLPAGATVALVGENGAGKSTLVKLLARLHDPSRGHVLVDGHDLRALDPEAWRARISAGFQDFAKFEFLAQDSVGVGDVARLDDAAVVRGALDRGDASSIVDRLPSGLKTQLGKRFSGAELSGGQWQRMSLARAFMRNRTLLLLLDEPTAALDPEAEHELFERFASAASLAARETGGVTVLVSHRFSTVRMADLIVVMHMGRVEEVGTHEELILQGGRYAELFELQARAYR